MANVRPDGAPWNARNDLDEVSAYLRHCREGATALEIIHGTRLGVTAVIPALNALIANGVVQRRLATKKAAEPASTFLLTPAGRRLSGAA